MSKITMNALISAFWTLLNRETLDKITVKSVIEAAQVNRNTFYYHFEDIYALMEAAFRQAAEKYRAETDESASFYEEYVRAAGFFMENKQAIIHIWNSKSRDLISRYMQSASELFVSRFVRQAAEGKPLSSEGLAYITRFYSYAILGSTLQWVEQGFPEYSADRLRTVSQSFEATVGIMIDDFIKHHPQPD